ncbi:MAG: FecR domain-containing protein [Bacteroidota bacterium]
MAKQTNISDNDPNAVLARRLGEALDAGTDIATAIDDPLIDLLTSYKTSMASAPSISAEQSSDLWQSIEDRVQSEPEPARILPLYKRSTVQIWAAAASILIVAFIGLFWYASLSTETLIGSTEGESLAVTLYDGSVVTLRAHSSLYEVTYSEQKHQYRLDGEAFFDVTSNPNRMFSVLTEQTEVQVLGTRFNVSTWGDQYTVFLEEGRVQVSALDNPTSFILNEGESAVYADGILTAPTPSPSELYMDWMDGVLTFDQTPLADAFAEIEHHYQIRILYEPDLADERLGGSLRLDELTVTLNNLAVILGGEFRSVGAQQFRFISTER